MQSGASRRAALLAVSVVLLLTFGCGGTESSGSSEPTGDDLKYGAFDVCTQFVEERLRSPASAQFPNEFEDDGEVTFTSEGGTWTITSHVDSENAFGALLRSYFVCQVRHVSGTQWQLVDLELVEG